MTTEKQLIANRANALKGGVKTVEGKLVSRMNAVSHGIFARDAILPGEDAALLNELQEKITAELQPVGELETILVQRIITSTWRLKRVIRTELKYTRNLPLEITGKKDFIPGGDYRYDSWQNFSRYESGIERQIYKAIHELERLQRARHGEKTPAPLVVDLDLSETSLDRLLALKKSIL